MGSDAGAAESIRGFRSDNASGAHPEVIEAVARANRGHVAPYGEDGLTASLTALFRERFGPDAHPFPVFNGTGANVMALQSLTRPQEAVICAASAHINVDEAGAPERIAGLKLLEIETEHGKLTPELVEARIEGVGDPHVAQPRVVSISQSCELGSVYSPGEVEALADLAHSNGMSLHVDGARLSNAAAALGLDLGAAAPGADAICFGGTKNGLLLGEAVILFDPGAAARFEFIRKGSMQLASKMRFVSAQFEALLEAGLWRRGAADANRIAAELSAALEPVAGVEPVHPVEANEVFVRLSPEAIASVLEADPSAFTVWDEDSGTVRMVASWDSTSEDVGRVAGEIAGALS